MAGKEGSVPVRPKTLVALCACLLLVSSGLPLASAQGRVLNQRAHPADWKTWHLASTDEFRLSAPPGARSKKTKAELDQLRKLQSRRTPKIKKTIRRWNKGPSTLRWTDLALRMIKDHRPRPPAAARALAVLETGMYDAMLAAHDSRRAYAGRTRPKPAALDQRLRPLLGGRKGSSYAPAEVAIAGAAEAILPVLFPAEPPRTFEKAARAASRSRLFAAANYQSDVTRARRLGRRVGASAVARLTDPPADPQPPTFVHGPVPEGEEYWSPTAPHFINPPIGGMVGAWKPWLIEDFETLRATIPGPYAYGSPEFLEETNEVVDVASALTVAQEAQAFFWDDGPGTYTPPGHWLDEAVQLIRSPGEPGFALGKNETARALALLAAVEADAAIAAWEAKYYWWSIRPITAIRRLCDDRTRFCTEEEAQAADPETAPFYPRPPDQGWLATIVTPAFPSYPGGHSTFSGAAGKMITYFFPEAGEHINAMAQDAADSRLYGGIHFRSDNEDGLTLGRAVADLGIARAESDGSGL